MQLQAGKCYVDRKGREFGPLSRCGALFGEGPNASSIWYNNGAASLNRESSVDLIAEAVPETVPEWRMLRTNEVIERGDEVMYVGGKWTRASASIGHVVSVGDVGTIRRRIVPQASSDPHMLETECISHVLRPGVDSVWNGNAWIPYTGEKTCLGTTIYARARFAKSAAPVALPRDINYIPRYADGWKPEKEVSHVATGMLNIIFHSKATPEEREQAALTLVEVVYPELLARKQ